MPLFKQKDALMSPLTEKGEVGAPEKLERDRKERRGKEGGRETGRGREG